MVLRNSQGILAFARGNYRFCVRIEDFIGRYSEASTDWFQVATPWHQTWLAYFSYLTLGCVTVYFGVALRTRRLEQANLAMKTLVDERTEAAEALRKSEERFTAFMDNSPFISWLKILAEDTSTFVVAIKLKRVSMV